MGDKGPKRRHAPEFPVEGPELAFLLIVEKNLALFVIKLLIAFLEKYGLSYSYYRNHAREVTTNWTRFDGLCFTEPVKFIGTKKGLAWE